MDRLGDILIVSDENDTTTDTVLDWLQYLNQKFIRINGSTPIDFECINFPRDIVKIKTKNEIKKLPKREKMIAGIMKKNVITILILVSGNMKKIITL